MKLTLLKLGGELLENPAKMAAVASTVARATLPLVVVHGGGREIDAALATDSANRPSLMPEYAGSKIADSPSIRPSRRASSVSRRKAAALRKSMVTV